MFWICTMNVYTSSGQLLNPFEVFYVIECALLQMSSHSSNESDGMPNVVNAEPTQKTNAYSFHLFPLLNVRWGLLSQCTLRKHS